jgi:uncharacterized delta-60 repeat protein
MKPVGIRTGQLVLLGLTLLLTACGGGEPSLQEEALLLQPSVSRLAIAPGGTANLRVKVERLGRLTGAVVVTAEGGPAGMSTTEPLILSASETEGTLLLKASPQAEAGTRGRMLLSAWSGNELYHSSVDVDVIAPFTLSTVVETVTVEQSKSVSVQVSLKRTAGFKEPVRLAASTDLPPGISVTPGPITLPADATGALFEVRASFDASTASHRIPFFATWGDVTTSTFLTVNVNPGPQFWDDTFGTFGAVLLPEPRYISSAVVQPDGRIVLAAGYGTSPIWIYRLLANGSVDTAFGQQGVVEFALAEYHTDPKVRLQPDGKVVVMTLHQGNVVLYRLLADGTPDTAFGTQGRAAAALSSYIPAGDVAVQEDGRILVAALTSSAVECMRFTTTGQVDETYGNLGRVTLHANTGLSLTDFRLRVDSRGATVVSGTYGGSDVGRVYVARLTSQGQRDTAFGVNGVATLNVALNFHLQGIARASDGWVVIGHIAVDNKAPGEHRLLRLYENAVNAGLQWSASMASTDNAARVAALSDGRVLVLANGQLKRWLASGQPDSNFQVNSAYGNGLYPIAGDAVLVGQYQQLRKLKPPAP